MTQARNLRHGKARLLARLPDAGPTIKTRAQQSGARPIAAEVAKAAAKSLKKHGLTHTDLLTAWPEIVGADLAAVCRPERLTRRGAVRTLTLRTWGAAALRIQHQEAVILERLNRHFGTAVADRLALVQGMAPAGKNAEIAAEPTDALPQQSGAALTRLAEGPLRSALSDLGARVRAARPPGPRRRD